MLFGVVSGSFQPVLDCSESFYFLEATISLFVLQLYYKRLHVDFITKWGSSNVSQSRANLIKKWRSFLYCKTGQVVLQSRSVITQWGNFYDKAGADITEPDKLYYKVV